MASTGEGKQKQTRGYGAGGVAAGTTPTKTLSWSFARDKMAIGGVAIKPAVTATFAAAEDTM